MKKLLGLAGIVLAAAGCTSFNYGAKDTLYLMGPHGEPAPVLKSQDSPQPRSMLFETYSTENGDVLTVRDYQGDRVGSCKPTISLFKYIDMPDGTKVLTLEPVKIGIHSELFSEQANTSYEPPILPTQKIPKISPSRGSGLAIPPISSR